MKINDAGLALIESFEGCRLTAYKDLRGIFTIGYGHTGEDVTEGLEIDQDGANELLRQDLERTSEGVEEALQVPITDNQFSALVAFAFNVGVHACTHSTLMKLLNAGQPDQAAEQFVKWCNAGGALVPGLLRRRKAEQALFLTA